MTLFDTNVVIDALYADEPHHAWAVQQIAEAGSSLGAGVNAVTVAEITAGAKPEGEVASELRAWGIQILDIPSAASIVCGRAYRRYAALRRRSGGGSAPRTPLPDFFIGAHAQIMGWKLATRDVDRYATYFPEVKLIHP